MPALPHSAIRVQVQLHVLKQYLLIFALHSNKVNLYSLSTLLSKEQQ